MNADMVSEKPLRLGVSLSLVPDYLPSRKKTLRHLAPLFRVCREAGAETEFVPMTGFYQVLYHVMEQGSFALNRYDPREEAHSRVRSVPFREDLALCSSFLKREGETDAPVRLLRDWLLSRFRETL